MAVAGIGISNRPLIDFLLERGAHVTARDKKERGTLGEIAGELEARGVRLICGEGYLDGIDEEYIFRTPGLRYDTPQIAEAVKKGSVLTSEMELFFELSPTKIIGITGSDGKTTTTNIIYRMLSRAGRRVFVGGNIGAPLLPELSDMTQNDIAVVELSSFQLHTMRRSCHCAVITNLSPNHLDYHTDMNEYIEAKTNIFIHPQNKRLVLNKNCPVTRQLEPLARADSEIIFFNDENGVHEKNKTIYFKNEPLFDTADILIPGRHNAENYMAAAAAVYGLANPDDMREIARTFGGAEHRNEFVRELRGVRYYNSSIDSSPSRTKTALYSYDRKVILILGGKDKNIPFDSLRIPVKECAKRVILTGQTGPALKKILENREDDPMPPSDLYPNFDDAVIAAAAAAEDGDIVLLSPAGTSFDAFTNFEERGNRFKTLINNLT